MTLTMFDSINVSQLPKGDYAYGAYVNGRWATHDAVVAGFPGKTVLSIAVSADADAQCLDIERGDAVNSDAPAWIHRQIARGIARPCLYTSASNIDALVATLTASGISRSSVRLWSAHYGNGEHICGPGSCKLTKVTVDGTQWNDQALGRNLDQSVLADDFFDNPKPPSYGPVVNYGEDNMNRQEIQIPKLDSDGNGWVSTQIPFDKYVHAFVAGPAPQRDGYWPIAAVAPNDTNGTAEIAIEHSVPGGAVTLVIWSVN